MNFRSDLALEILDNFTRLENGLDFDEESVLKRYGIKKTHEKLEGVDVDRIEITSAEGAKALGRPIGNYVTLAMPPLSDDETQMEAKAIILAKEIDNMLVGKADSSKQENKLEDTVLVVGLGNNEVTPDALGPRAVSMVLATRHIKEEFARSCNLEDLRSTAVFAPGVLGQTGLESGEMVRGVCDTIKPVAVIVVDALAARSLDRLGTAVQLSDTGISPGSGVGNNRIPLNFETLNVPVISIGIPTVVDVATLISDLTVGNGSLDGKAIESDSQNNIGANMMVTPREIDILIERAARLIAMGINSALQPSYPPLSLINIAG